MKRSQVLRIVSLLGFLALLSWIGYRHQVVGGGPTGIPSVDALCPMGGLESLYSFATQGTWLRRVAPSALVLFIAAIVMTLLLGRVFCGWLCPFGALSELPNRMAKKFGFKGMEFSPPVDKALRFLKYALLILIVYFTWKTGELVFREYDPWMAWMHITAGFEGAVAATTVLFVALIGSFLVSRFWCRYLCPLGAALSLGQWVAPLKIRRNTATCIDCKKCDKACPVALKPSLYESMTSLECIACGECAAVCPKDGTLDFATRGRKRVVSAMLVGIISVAILGGGILVSRMAGFWKTFAQPGSGAAAVAKSPADDIFGWMTLKQVSETVGLPLEKVIEIAGLPADVSLEEGIKKLPGVNDEELRAKLKEYLAKNPKIR